MEVRGSLSKWIVSTYIESIQDYGPFHHALELNTLQLICQSKGGFYDSWVVKFWKKGFLRAKIETEHLCLLHRNKPQMRPQLAVPYSQRSSGINTWMHSKSDHSNKTDWNNESKTDLLGRKIHSCIKVVLPNDAHVKERVRLLVSQVLV